MTLPNEDDFVQVSASAPDQYSPGKRGVVVSVAQCISKVTNENTGIPIGDYVILVGVVNGEDIEAKVIPAEWLKVVDQID